MNICKNYSVRKNNMVARKSKKRASSSPELVITRILNAPRSLVWKAWTDPKQVKQWWGPRGFTNPVCKLDLRPGGSIRIDMRGPDGTVFPMTGTYTEITKPKRLVFTSGALGKDGNPLFEVLTTVTFVQQGDKTALTVRARVISSTAAAAPHIAGMNEGWSQTLDRLAEHMPVKNNPLIIERTFNAPAATVWKALTNKEDFKRWYFDMKEFKPEVGFEFRFSVKHNGMHYHHICKVTALIPRRKLAYTWRYDGHKGDSLVIFELFAEGNKTKLRLTHKGLETFPKTRSFVRTNFIGGWTMLLGTNLKRFVEPKSNRK
jgi:uncharacterized protein YndB with AHSA1/START domain